LSFFFVILTKNFMLVLDKDFTSMGQLLATLCFIEMQFIAVGEKLNTTDYDIIIKDDGTLVLRSIIK
jgi:hypothetical protein